MLETTCRRSQSLYSQLVWLKEAPSCLPELLILGPHDTFSRVLPGKSSPELELLCGLGPVSSGQSILCAAVCFERGLDGPSVDLLYDVFQPMIEFLVRLNSSCKSHFL